MDNLPNELLISIILRIRPLDLYGWRCANHQFHQLYLDEYHWKCRFNQHFGPDPSIPKITNIASLKLYRYWSGQRSDPPQKFEFNTPCNSIDRLNTHIKRSLLTNGLKAGDLVHYFDKYFIYNGTQFHETSKFLKEPIPGIQPIEDFPIHHWSQYFNEIPLSIEPYRSDLIKHFTFVRLQNQGQIVYRTSFSHWSGIIYTLLILKRSNRGITLDEFKHFINSQSILLCYPITKRSAKYYKKISYDPKYTLHFPLFESPMYYTC